MDTLRVVDDARILELAESPAVPLFRILNRPRAIAPLLVVLLTVCVVCAVRYRTYDESAAVSMRHAARTVAAESIFPAGEIAESDSSVFAAPLSSWFAATAITVCPANWTWAVVAPSMVAYVASVVLLLNFVGRGFGGRTAVWCVVLTSLHPVLLDAAASPSPRATALLFAVLAVGWHLDCRESGCRPLDRRVWLTGVALGFLLLTSGPMAVVLGCALVVDSLLQFVAGSEAEPNDDEEPDTASKRFGPGRAAVLATLGVMLATAAVVGGWWVGVNVLRFGPIALIAWLELPHGRAELASGAVALGRTIVNAWGVAGGLVLIGLWRYVRRRDGSGSRQRCPVVGARFVVVWGVVSLLPGLVYRTGQWDSGWICSAMPPAMLLAAMGVEAIASRRVASTTAFALLLGWPALVVIGWITSDGDRVTGGDWTLSWSLVGVAALAIVAVVSWVRNWRDEYRRAALTAGVVGTVVVCGISGIAATNRVTEDDITLRRLQVQLGSHRDAAATILVGDVGSPQPLSAVLRILSPHGVHAAAPNRDVALGQVLDVLEPGEHAIIAELETRKARPLDVEPRRLRIANALPPQPYRHRRLRAYVVVPAAAE